MGGRVLEPLRLPDGFWTRLEVHDALIQRDFGALFRLVAKYAGASQTLIAIAVGMTQGQVSTIMAGDRRISAIDVAERALEGLGAPDPARIAFGLAPRATPAALVQDRQRIPAAGWPDTGDGGGSDRVAEDGVDRREVLRLGGTVAFATAAGESGRAGQLTEVARALTPYPMWTPAATTESGSSVADLAAAVERAKRSYQACRYGAVLGALPGLLEEARLACESADGDQLLRAHGLAADAHQVTGSVMLKLGDTGLAALAADRSMQAAVRSQDPVVLAASARIVVHSLIGGGHAGRATELAAQAAQRLAAEMRHLDADALSVYGALVLRGAVAAAGSEDRQAALQLLDEAQDAARQLGHDGNAHWTAFGPTNVTQHRVHVAVMLGDAGTAVHLARQIDVRQIPIAERKATLFIDTAAAFAQWGKHEQAYEALRTAERVAPEEFRTRRTVHQFLGNLAAQAPRDVRSKVYEFADRIGVQL